MVDDATQCLNGLQMQHDWRVQLLPLDLLCAGVQISVLRNMLHCPVHNMLTHVKLFSVLRV
jgi:hypothetical protein